VHAASPVIAVSISAAWTGDTANVEVASETSANDAPNRFFMILSPSIYEAR
jgi:hypothetical protein